jgi:exodeoxyribonuclease VII large subunit
VEGLARAGVERLRRDLAAILRQYSFRRVQDLFVFWRQRTDDLRARLEGGARATLEAARGRLERARAAWGLREALPRRLAEARAGLARSHGSLRSAMVALVDDGRRRRVSLDDRLRALSPRLVLERGYALVRGPGGTFVRSAAALDPGARVTLEFARGEADATVTEVRSETNRTGPGTPAGGAEGGA